MPYVYITSFSGPPATITVCDTVTNTICYTYPTQLTDLGPFPFIINLPSPDFDDVAGITLTAQSINGCSIVQQDICSILPTPSPTSAPVPCFEVVINGEFNTNFNGWSAQTADWSWSSFNGGSAYYDGENGYLKLAQTGYTFLEGFNYTISYDVYALDELSGNAYGFVWPTLGDNSPVTPPGPYPTFPVSAWTQFSYSLDSGGDNTLKMVGFAGTEGIYLDNVSACFTYGPCYYMEFATNNNFSVSGTVDYVDCNGVLQTYTANTQGTFYLCAIQSAGSVDIDVVDTSYLCTDAGGGTWVPPYLESPTPTPSNPPTPTPTPVSSYSMMEYMYFTLNAATNNVVSVTIQTIGGTASVNWGDGNVSATTTPGSTVTFTHTYSAPTSGQLRISGQTNNANQIQNIGRVTVSGNIPSPILTGDTQQLKRLINANTIETGSQCSYVTGNISAFSSCTSLQFLSLGNGNYTGDIDNLPSSLKTILFNGPTNNIDVNTVSGNISNLPNTLRTIKIFGNNTLNGNTSSLVSKTWETPPFPFVTELSIGGHNTITGLMSNLPDIDTIQISEGNTTYSYNPWSNPTGNTISGPLTLKANQKTVFIYGGNIISGNISAISGSTILENLGIYGKNTISGDTSGIICPTYSLYIAGNNTISGNLSNITFNAQIQRFQIWNLANGQFGTDLSTTGTTITGDISALNTAVTLRNFVICGNNTISGNLASLTNINDIGVLIINSNGNQINGASLTHSLFFNNSIITIFLRSNSTGNGLSSTQVNNFLIYLDNNYPSWGSLPTDQIFVVGTGHSAPTGAGITAKFNLIAQGLSVVTN
jgi:hypothetical protein